MTKFSTDVAPPCSQICNYCKWGQMLANFANIPLKRPLSNTIVLMLTQFGKLPKIRGLCYLSGETNTSKHNMFWVMTVAGLSNVAVNPPLWCRFRPPPFFWPHIVSQPVEGFNGKNYFRIPNVSPSLCWPGPQKDNFYCFSTLVVWQTL